MADYIGTGRDPMLMSLFKGTRNCRIINAASLQIESVLRTRGLGLSDQDKTDLVEFLKSLPQPKKEKE